MLSSISQHRFLLPVVVAATLSCRNDVAPTDSEEDEDSLGEGCGDGQPSPGEFCHSIETTSLPPRSFQVGDFNADGHLDVGSVGVAGTTATFEYWVGNGEGGFSNSPTVVEMPQLATIRLAAELDGNPGTDFLIVNNSTGEIFSYLNNVGEFQSPVVSSPSAGMFPWNSVTLFDAQGDGIADLLVESFGGIGPLHVLVNNDGVFESEGFTAETDAACSHSDTSLLPGFSQFAGGLVFLAGECGVNGPPTDAITVILTRVNGQLAEPQILNDGTSPTEVVAGDFDGDGTPVFVVWDKQLQAFQRYGGGISGTFEQLGEMSFDEFCNDCGITENQHSTGLVVGDFDGVGGDDVVLQHGETTFVTEMIQQESQVTHTREVAHGTILVAEFNGDGVDDILVSHNGSEFATLLLSRP